MLYGFAIDNEAMAKGAQIVYAVYRSRDKNRGPSGVDMWAQIERFIRSSAKRAIDLGGFVDSFKRKMGCGTLNPRWMKTDNQIGALIQNADGSFIKLNQEDGRAFMIDLFSLPAGEQQEIVEMLYQKAQIVVLLVRERLEREKPIEGRFENVKEGENHEDE